MSQSRLIAYLELAKSEMDAKIPFSKRWEIFVYKRYTLLSKQFPHKTFSVEECSFEFFSLTLAYLRGEIELPKKEPGREFKNNYIDWINNYK